MRITMNLTAALAALTLLAACSDDGTPAEPTSAPTPAGAPAEPTDAYDVPGAYHLDGPGLWGLPGFAAPDATPPLAVFDVPAGFQGHESFVWTDLQGPDEFSQLTYWSPSRVLTDPCDRSTATEVGPSVTDLVEALADQERTTTSRPEPVTLDGHRGFYVELTTPARLDPRSCRRGLQVWDTGRASGGRELDTPAVDRYWILDVEDQRVVIAAMTGMDATPDTVELIVGVAESAEFVDA